MARKRNKIASGRDVCKRVTFSLVAVLGANADLEALGHTLCDWPNGETDEALILGTCRGMVMGVANLKRLPSIVPVIVDDSGEKANGFTDDLATTLAVLTRSSKNVFMRRAYAMVTRERLEREVTLILPADWSAN